MIKRYDEEPIDPNCAAQHFDTWLISPVWFTAAVKEVRAGTWQLKAFDHLENDEPMVRILYTVDNAGIATIVINGPMMKGDSKFGGTSTIRTRRAIRQAANDAQVLGIMLVIDSPGGTVAGTAELATDIALANSQKPVFAHIDDTGASAAFWVASQAGFISAGVTAEVGSIGVIAVVEDTSEQFAADGIVVHVVSTGEFKGAFADGTPITSEHLAYLQERLDDINTHFLAAVGKGRHMTKAAVSAAADGRVFGAVTAMELGLIDKVQRLDDTTKDLIKAIKANKVTPRRDRADLAIRLAEH